MFEENTQQWVQSIPSMPTGLNFVCSCNIKSALAAGCISTLNTLVVSYIVLFMMWYL